ncbi:cell division protein FtsQ/DivIB [Pinisolibacter aquiterrae]|uniref:cell division protein FtsQ/DivIB n=1 Tax=Pinisolibacter aquiterrae TaxID=2815579 RepID=UPI001C3E1EAD|nr:cell division protein FtsQ/DivIB [Pinisolibacter aquiterrae]
MRTVRRWTRLADRMLSSVRPMQGTVAALAFLGAWGVYGMALSGAWRTAADALTAGLGFSVASIEIRGLSEADSTEISDRIDVTQTSSLLMVDVEKARSRIAEIPWIADVAVKKLYPNRIVVNLTERRPFALWQDEGKVRVVDRTGAVMSDVLETRNAGLPLIVGQGANTRVAEAVELMNAAPSLRPKIRAAVLVAERRWNMITVDGIEILLPEENPAAALERVAVLQDSKKLLERDVEVVDMRVPDRLFVRLSDAAAAVRREQMRIKSGAKKEARG